MSHGPYLVDHNVLASPASLELFSQGGAFVNNLVCGTVAPRPGPGPADALPRAAQHPGRRLRRHPRRRRPLHRQRLPRRRRRRSAYGPTRTLRTGAGYGTAGYDGHPASFADYLALVDDPSRGDHERFTDVKQPVYIRDNVYAAGAGPYEAEHDAARPRRRRRDGRRRRRGRRGLPRDRSCPRRSTARASGSSPAADLERVRFVDAEFEEPDGSPASLDTDLVGGRKTDGRTYPAGPIATLASGSSRTRVW